MWVVCNLKYQDILFQNNLIFKTDQNICYGVFLNNNHRHSLTNTYIQKCDLCDGGSDVDKTSEVLGNEGCG